MNKYYHLYNATTNELIYAKWSRIPSQEQLKSVRSRFGWNNSDKLLLKGRKRSFRVIGDVTLTLDGYISYSIIIPDRSYWINFESDNSIKRVSLIESYTEIEDLIACQ